ncbi:GntR family transcriptional regulator [Microbaculum sp. FT89]|uniref:GntR family transcriptional regulator n=1 Tax=Microbaculum sp. FT89 TaxID=3447298 RepID=UPI003F53C787
MINDSDVRTDAGGHGKTRPGLRDTAYDAIKREIITLALAPGTFHSESEICARLGLTKGPVHQALVRLMQDGLVQLIPRKGVMIAPVTLEEVQNVIDVRYLNEPYAAAAAARLASEQDLVGMRALITRFEKLGDQAGAETLMELDREFHRRLADCAQNRLLADLLVNLHDRSLRFWVISLSQNERVDVVTAEHREIVDALTARDPDAAKAAMQRHIKSFRSAIAARVS